MLNNSKEFFSLINILENNFNNNIKILDLNLTKINGLIKKELNQIIKKANLRNGASKNEKESENMMHLILLDEFDYLFFEHNEIKIDPELELKNEIEQKNLKLELLSFDEMMEYNKQMIFFKNNKENYIFPIINGHYFVVLKDKHFDNIIYSIFTIAFDIFTSTFILQKVETWMDFIKSFKPSYVNFKEKISSFKMTFKDFDEWKNAFNHFIKTILKDDFYLLNYRFHNNHKKSSNNEDKIEKELWIDVSDNKGKVNYKWNGCFLKIIYLTCFSIELQKEVMFILNISQLKDVKTEEVYYEMTASANVL